MLVWTETGLPRCVVKEGLEVPFRDGRLRTAPDRGRAFLRGGSDATPVPAMLTSIMRLWEVARFEKFFLYDAERGTLPFLIPDPVYDGARELDEDGAEVLDEDYAPIIVTALWLVQFADQPPTPRRLSRRFFQVMFSVEVL